MQRSSSELHLLNLQCLFLASAIFFTVLPLAFGDVPLYVIRHWNEMCALYCGSALLSLGWGIYSWRCFFRLRARLEVARRRGVAC